MLRIRTPLGLGDAVYTFPIVKHFAQTEKVIVCTQYPDVFKSLGIETTAEKTNQDLCLRYQFRAEKDYYTQMCDLAGVHPEFKLDWPYRESDDCPSFIHDAFQPVCVIKEPVCGHMHKGSKNFSMAPNVERMQNFVNKNNGILHFVSVGEDEVFKARLSRINTDLNNRLSVHDLISIVTYSSVVVTQIGHLVPLAQALGKPLKIFEPEQVTDRRLIGINANKVLAGGAYPLAEVA